jgi:hypothetical protein
MLGYENNVEEETYIGKPQFDRVSGQTRPISLERTVENELQQ